MSQPNAQGEYEEELEIKLETFKEQCDVVISLCKQIQKEIAEAELIINHVKNNL